MLVIAGAGRWMSAHRLSKVTGNSFTVNATGLALLRLFRRERDLSELVAQITSEFDVSAADAERDALDFAALIRNTLRP
jgi:hypothetical protein